MAGEYEYSRLEDYVACIKLYGFLPHLKIMGLSYCDVSVAGCFARRDESAEWENKSLI